MEGDADLLRREWKRHAEQNAEVWEKVREIFIFYLGVRFCISSTTRISLIGKSQLDTKV